MFDKNLAKKIDNLIIEKFPIIYEYDFDGIVLLCGGAIRNTIMGKSIKDLDFVILTQSNCKIVDFIKKYNLKYTKSLLGGYKIFFNHFKVDIFTVNDLLDAVVYDLDLLMYDIQKHLFISCGGFNSIENKVITQINYNYNVNYKNIKREKKLKEFVEYVNPSNKKKVKIRKNKMLYVYYYSKYKMKSIMESIFRGNFIKCLRFVKGTKKSVFLVSLLVLIISLLSLIQPSLLGILISSLMDSKYNLMLILILTLFVLKLIILLLQFVLAKLYLGINKNMINNIKRDVINSVLNLEMSNFTNNNRGVFIEKLNSDPKEIVRIFNSIKDLCIRELGNVGVILLVFFLDYRIGLILLLAIYASIKIMVKGINQERKHRIKYHDSNEKYSALLGEMINGIDDIKKLSLKDNYTKITTESYEMVTEYEFDASYCYRAYRKTVNIVQIVAVFIISLIGLYLVKNGELEQSSLVIILLYNTTIFHFINKIGLFMNLISKLNISCDRLFSLLDGHIYNNESYGNKYNAKCNGVIEFSNVNFRYNYGDNYVLNNCSFKVNSNELVAIVGKSGEGKTTILNLISSLYSINDGVIRIDGIDINEYSEKFLKNNVSVISQSPYLFDMSIKENLRLVKETITDKEIIDVCRLVCLDNFIESLPGKYDSVIGEGGIKLSGGQKQRLGIARALIKNTKIILLDEITSALDNESGTVIKKVINNIKKNHTVIVVTHELSMIKDADRILVLDNGKIVGDGKHKDLLKNNEVYKKLYKIK